MGRLRLPCHYATQDKEAESMTPITKNEKLTIWQKIFAEEVTIKEGNEEGEGSPPL
jgi:hypothetical protein